LTIFAAGTHAAVELQIVADHGHAVHHFRTIANQRCTLDRRGNLAVFDQVGFAGGEHEFAAGDIYLATAQIGAVDALLD